MLTDRIIPCLDIEDGRVVKGTQFKEIRDAGDPVECARRYNADGADEITFLDIGATYRSREILCNVVAAVSAEVFVPLTVGGGIRTVDDMRMVLRAGADKVSICSAALRDPNLISRGAEIFGRQCIVLSVDAKRTVSSWECYTAGGRNPTDQSVLAWVREAQRRGAGEVLLNSIDRDGATTGYDIELTRAVSDAVDIPVIASGGAGNGAHLEQAFTAGHADAVLLAGILHYGRTTIRGLKEYLRKRGRSVR